MSIYNTSPYNKSAGEYKQDGYSSYNWNDKPDLIYEEDKNGE